MALFKTLDGARQDLSNAETALNQWEAKHAGATAELAKLETTSIDQILEDPSLAETHAFKESTLRGQIKVYAQAAEAARAKILTRHQDVLEAEAKHEDKQAAAADKELAKHEVKVKAVLATLQELDGAEYVVKTIFEWNGELSNYQLQTKTALLRGAAEDHAFRAYVIREFLNTGEIHNNNYGVGELPGVGTKFNASKHVPASVRAAKAAGLNQESSNAV